MDVNHDHIQYLFKIYVMFACYYSDHSHCSVDCRFIVVVTVKPEGVMVKPNCLET